MKKILASILILVFFAGMALAQSNPITGNDWLKLNKKQRVQIVSDFIKTMRKEGVTISNSPAYYCQKLDALYIRKPNLKNEPAWRVLKTNMIMEYDWKVRGQSQDSIAREWLGEDLYRKNKARRTQK